MKNFNYVDTDSAKTATAEEMKGVEFGLMTTAIRKLLAGEKNVEVTIDGETIEVVHEVSRKPIGDAINGNYIVVYATTEENIYLFVRINEWCNVYSAEFGSV